MKGVNEVIKDSGSRREFETGAVRDIQEGKGRCDLLPLDVIAELYKTFFPDGNDWLVFWKLYEFKRTAEMRCLFEAIDASPDLAQSFSTIFLEVSKHFEEGAAKYGEYNWQKGIPVHCYIDSAIRHYLKWIRGDDDERHDRAFVWNILCCSWTCRNKPELDDFTDKESEI